MYSVWLSSPETWPDGECIYDNTVDDKRFQLIDPELNLKVNNAGSFKFKMASDHLYYDKVKKQTSILRVVRDGVVIWEGRVIDEQMNWQKDKTFTVEGAMAYFNDTTQPYKIYRYETGSQFLQQVIGYHNNKVESYKRIDVGCVTVDLSEFAETFQTNYVTTMETINDLISTFGGNMFIVYNSDGTKTLHWLKDPKTASNQTIEFGMNLLDYTHSFDITEFCTVVVPLGKTLIDIKREYNSVVDDDYQVEITDEDEENSEQRLDISSVNDGLPYLVNAEALAQYGWIERVLEFDDISDPNRLKELGNKYLSQVQFDKMTIEITAYDLALQNKRIDWIPEGVDDNAG